MSAIGSLAEVIEKPAERFGLALEPGLSERIVEDVHTADALPLLAYTLKALHDRSSADRRLTLDGYHALGGVQGAIAAKLQSVLSDPEPTAEETRALQRAFTRHSFGSTRVPSKASAYCGASPRVQRSRKRRIVSSAVWSMPACS